MPSWLPVLLGSVRTAGTSWSCWCFSNCCHAVLLTAAEFGLLEKESELLVLPGKLVRPLVAVLLKLLPLL